MKTAYILPLSLMFLGGLASAPRALAQELEKEITIDRDIVPEQRAAARPTVYPSVDTPRPRTVNLKMQAGSIPAPLSPSVFRFEPASTEPAFNPTPWRGYVDLGYFPTADVALSAGYAIVATRNTALNVWLQADNRSYKGDEGTYKDFRFKSLDIAGGLDFAQRFGAYNRLTIGASAAYSNWSVPDDMFRYTVNESDVNQSVHPGAVKNLLPGALTKSTSGDPLLTDPKFPTGLLGDIEPYNLSNFRFRFNAGFDGRYSDHLTYAVGARFGLFNNKNTPVRTILNTMKGHRSASSTDQITFDLNGRVREQVSDNAAVSLDIESRILRYSSMITPGDIFQQITFGTCLFEAGAKSMAQIDFIPAAEYNSGVFSGRVGARLGLSVNSGKSFHVAPDVMLAINPDARFGAWLRLGGGVETNPLESIFARSRYADTRIGYGFSNVAFSGQFGLRVGPFRGAALTLTADYAAANNWLMPYMADNCVLDIAPCFAPGRIRAWKVGARIDWQYRSLVELSLSYEGTLGGNGDEKSWLYWTDRARHVLGASATVRPIDRLSVDLGFTARLDRRQKVDLYRHYLPVNDQDYKFGEFYGDRSIDLGDLTNLWAGASYRFTPAFTLFGRVDNILNKRSQLTFGIPSQGLTGLVGIGYKF